MKIAIAALLVGSAAAFAPAQVSQASTTALNAEAADSRRAFLGAAATVFAAAAIPAAANAGTMLQENVSDPTEVWETGKPSDAAKSARIGRYTNARTQMTSSFPPQKRLTLERKSPVTRLDINSPDFTAYKKTFPGLYKEAPKSS